MKLRIRGDSIRLRLKRGEVDQIAAGASIVEETHFPDAVLTFRLDVSENDDTAASFEQRQSDYHFAKIKNAWIGQDTDEVSLAAEQKLCWRTVAFRVLIEKDFSCLEPGHHRDCEDDADTFPHPRADTHSHRRAKSSSA